MKKWYGVQFVITMCVNILTFLAIKVGEFFSNREYIYEAETYVIILTLLALSFMICLLGILYSKDGCEDDLQYSISNISDDGLIELYRIAYNDGFDNIGDSKDIIEHRERRIAEIKKKYS